LSHGSRHLVLLPVLLDFSVGRNGRKATKSSRAKRKRRRLDFRSTGQVCNFLEEKVMVRRIA
jgi:hypothetical protein